MTYAYAASTQLTDEETQKYGLAAAAMIAFANIPISTEREPAALAQEYMSSAHQAAHPGAANLVDVEQAMKKIIEGLKAQEREMEKVMSEFGVSVWVGVSYEKCIWAPLKTPISQPSN